MGLYLHLNNHYEYEHLIDEDKDFHIPEAPLPKMEVYLPKLYDKDYNSEQVQWAIRDLVWLNRNCDRAFLIEAIPHNLRLEDEEKEDAIEKINEYVNSYNQGTLEPEHYGDWWVITREGFDGRGKHKILEERLNTQKISDAINELQDGTEKITQARVSKHSKLSLRTVKSRWAMFKSNVAECNKEIKKRQAELGSGQSNESSPDNSSTDLDYDIDPTF